MIVGLCCELANDLREPNLGGCAFLDPFLLERFDVELCIMVSWLDEEHGIVCYVASCYVWNGCLCAGMQLL